MTTWDTTMRIVLRLLPLVLCFAALSTALAGPRGPSPEEELGVLAHKDLAAVQKPVFSTSGKVELAAQFVTIPSDPYILALQGSAIGTWYATERLALEALVSAGNGWETSESTRLASQGVQVDSYTPRFISSVNVQWTPIYAKLSLLGFRIVHFDTSITGGIGAFVARRTIYNAMEASPDAERYNHPASVNLGLTQRYYGRAAGHMFAIRADARDYLYVLRTLEATRVIKHNWYFGIGISWFFDLFGEQGGDHA